MKENSLEKAINIGPVVAEQLRETGISTLEALREKGSKEAWLAIQAMDPSACYNRLCGLEGAIREQRWHHLPQEVKDDLKAFYEAHKIVRP